MKRFKEFSKKISEFYQWILKYSLWLLAVISFWDIYFYLQILDQRFTIVFVEFRLLFAVFVIFHGILGICKPLWNYYALKRALTKKECEKNFLDVELYCPPKIEPKSNFFNNIYKGTEEDDLIIKDYIFHLKSVNEDIQQCYLLQMLKYFSKAKPPIDNMIENGILPVLVELLHSKNIQINKPATLLIRLIMETSYSYYVKNAVEAGAISPLIEVLKIDNCQEDALVALLFIVSKKPYDELCVKNGIVEAFIKCFDSESISADFASNIISMVIRLCTISSADSSQNVKTLLPLLDKLPFEKNLNTINNILDLIDEFKDNGPKYIQLLIDNNIFILVIDYLEGTDETIEKRAFKIFFNLLNDDGIDKYAQHLKDSFILPVAHHIYNTTVDFEFREQILTFVGCLVNDDEIKIEAIITTDFIPMLLNFLNNGGNRDLLAVFKTLFNFIKSCNPKQAIILMDSYGIISICCNYLNDENLEYSKMALSCINELLKKSFDDKQGKEVCEYFVECGGFSEVERLQMHPRLAQLVNEIIKNYMNLKNNVFVTVENV